MTNKIDASFFDIEHDRANTGSVKYDAVKSAIPMWVADMDFKVPPEVEEALVRTARHGIFGYTDTDAEYDDALASWYKRRMGWDVKPEWNVKTPGVMFGIAAALRAFTDEGDAVLICQPVYHPFAKIIPGNARRLVVSELRLSGGRYEFDFDDIETKIKENDVKIFLLCSPHNPVGRVWSRSELERIAQICLRHDVLIISDEIHSDFVYSARHTPMATLSDEVASRTITCTAPSKTFNLAGLQATNVFVSDDKLRRKLRRACNSTGYGHLNAMAIAAARAAYKYGEPWLEGLLNYLQGNVALLKDGVRSFGGKINLIQPEGTYLMWLDCRNLNFTDEQLDEFFLKKAGLLLNSGYIFGAGGSGFMRMNVGCTRKTLETAISKLSSALNLV